MITPLTLVVVHNDKQILLGKKKRGFATGLWNGFGGKVNEGESLEEAAMRELEEEYGITNHKLQSHGKILFSFMDHDKDLEVNIFSINDFNGEAVETEEMFGQWFDLDKIPYSEMWADDPFWLPHVLAGKNVSGRLEFDSPKDDSKTQRIVNNLIQIHE